MQINCPALGTHERGVGEGEGQAGVHRGTQRKQISPDGWTRCCDLGSQRVSCVQLGKAASLGTSAQDFSHQTSRGRFQLCLPRGAALRIIALLSEQKISVPGFQQELLELVKGTPLLKSRIKWQSFRTAVRVSLRWPGKKRVWGDSLEL